METEQRELSRRLMQKRTLIQGISDTVPVLAWGGDRGGGGGGGGGVGGTEEMEAREISN